MATENVAEMITALIDGEAKFAEETGGKLSGAGEFNNTDPFQSTGDLGKNIRLLRSIIDNRVEGVWSAQAVYTILRHYHTSFIWDAAHKPSNPYQTQIDAEAAAAKAKADKEAREAKFLTGLVQPKTEWDREIKLKEKSVKAEYNAPSVADETLPPAHPSCGIFNTEEDLRHLPLRQLMTGPHQQSFKRRMNAIIARANAERQRAAVALAEE